MNPFGATGKRAWVNAIGIGGVLLLLCACQPSSKPTTPSRMEPRVFIAPPLDIRPIIEENTAATLISQYPTSATAHYEMGRTLHARRRFADAVPFFKKCVEKDPLFVSAYFGLAESYRYSEPPQWMLAEQTYETLVKLAYTPSQRADAFMGLGNLYLDWHSIEGRKTSLTQALKAYRFALKADKQLSSAAYGIAIVYSRQQEWGKAERWFQEALSLASEPRDKAKALEALANIALIRGNIKEANNLIEEAKRAHPSYPATLWEPIREK